MRKILITGASGLVGKRLQRLLEDKGYAVNTIGRKGKSGGKKKNTFYWNLETRSIDEHALDGVDSVVHLAGAGVADERWTEQRKKEILDSRVQSTRLLFDTLKRINHNVSTIVAASAVGIYGDCGSKVVTEQSPAAKTFLADVCVQWEQEVKNFTELGIREVRCRIGIVLSKEDGALPELSKSLTFGVAGYFTKTPLYYPWIHLDDVCGIIIHALENKTLAGAYNTTAPHPLPLKDLMHAIVKGSGKRTIVVPAPTFALKLAMGEMADMLLSSQNCSAEKILKSGYTFQFDNAVKAVKKEFSA